MRKESYLFATDYTAYAQRLKQHEVEIPFQENDFYIYFKELMHHKNMHVSIAVFVTDEIQKQSWNSPCEKVDSTQYSFGDKCELAFQNLDSNYEYNFQGQGGEWVSFGISVKKYKQYVFTFEGLQQGLIMHHSFYQSREIMALQSPNFIENIDVIRSGQEQEYKFIPNPNELGIYLNECKNIYQEQMELTKKAEREEIDDEYPQELIQQLVKYEESYQYCLVNRKIILSLYFPKRNQQYHINLVIRDIDTHSISFFVYLVACTCTVIFFLVLIAILLAFINEKRHERQSERQQQQQQLLQLQQIAGQNQQNSNSNNNNNNVSEQEQQKQIIYVVMTSNTIEKYMPARTHKELIEVMPIVDEQKDCLICLNQFEEEEKCRMSICLHVFHVDCVDVWFKNHGSCPYCRIKINRKILEDTEQRKENIKKNPFLKKMIEAQVNSASSSDGGSCSKKKMKEFDFMYSEMTLKNSDDECCSNPDQDQEKKAVIKKSKFGQKYFAEDNQFDDDHEERKESVSIQIDNDLDSNLSDAKRQLQTDYLANDDCIQENNTNFNTNNNLFMGSSNGSNSSNSQSIGQNSPNIQKYNKDTYSYSQFFKQNQNESQLQKQLQQKYDGEQCDNNNNSILGEDQNDQMSILIPNVEKLK